MVAMSRLSAADIQSAVDTVQRDGYCVLPGYFPPRLLDEWRTRFTPLLERHIEREGHRKNRGTNRYYVTLPFQAPFADPTVYEDDDILAIVTGLVGEDPTMVQLATDTPLLGSDYQDIHRDAFPLFPELTRETPAFQLAVNFPLVEVTRENGPVEIAKGTHDIPKPEAMRRLAIGETRLEPVLMKLGDVMIRDVRGIHRGTPNHTTVPRPMVVVGYSRKWLLRPEVSIRIPRAALATLSERARRLLRTNPVVDDLTEDEGEVYQAFAY